MKVRWDGTTRQEAAVVNPGRLEKSLGEGVWAR